MQIVLVLFAQVSRYLFVCLTPIQEVKRILFQFTLDYSPKLLTHTVNSFHMSSEESSSMKTAVSVVCGLSGLSKVIRTLFLKRHVAGFKKKKLTSIVFGWRQKYLRTWAWHLHSSIRQEVGEKICFFVIWVN